MACNLQRIFRPITPGTSAFALGCTRQGEATILRLALVFLLIAILAGIFGFTWIEIVSIELARIAFFVFLVLFVIALIANATYRRPSDLV